MRFLRHLLEMIVAMAVGMAGFGLLLWAFGEPPGYDHPLVEHGLMSIAMAVPMVIWMRYRGHTWFEGAGMTAAMILPVLLLVVPVEFDLPVPRVSEASLMMVTHVGMLAGMVAWMIVRRDRYTHGSHA
jgi:hypothetical protein